jgi:hypothetical protein
VGFTAGLGMRWCYSPTCSVIAVASARSSADWSSVSFDWVVRVLTWVAKVVAASAPTVQLGPSD